MRTISKLALVAALLVVAPAVQASTTLNREVVDPAGAMKASSDLDAIRAIVTPALAALEKRDYATAIAGFDQAMNDPHFAGLNADARYGVQYLRGVAEHQAHQNDKAFTDFEQAGQVSPGSRDADYWFSYCSAAGALNKDEAVIDGLTRLATDFPNDAGDLRMEFVSDFVRRASLLKDGGARHRALLEALYAAHYTSDNPVWHTDGLWFQLFKIYADAGQDDKALSVLGDIKEPWIALEIGTDKRYRHFADAEKAAGSDRLDYAAVQARSLDQGRKILADNPKLLAASFSLADQLMEANQLSDALKVIDDALAKLASDPDYFTDKDEQLNWVYDTRSRVLARLGRWDEAEAAEIKGRDVAMAAGDDTVSQTINLADLYYVEGKAQLAVDTVKEMKPEQSSPYGLMSAQEARVCGYAQLNDQAHLAESLDYMRSHAEDGTAPLESALECVGDVDGLAKLIVGKLDDADSRTGMLAELQDYLPEPNPSPFAAKMMTVWQAAKARADVQASVAKYGYIESVPALASPH